MPDCFDFTTINPLRFRFQSIRLLFLVGVVSVFGVVTAHAQALAEVQTWKDESFGLVLELPAGSLQQYPAKARAIGTFHVNDALAHVFLQDFAMPTGLAEPGGPERLATVALEELVTAAAWEMLYTSSHATISSESEIEVAGRPGIRMELVVQDGERHFNLAQAFFKIDPFVVSCIQVESAIGAAQDAGELLDDLLAKLSLIPPEVLDADRAALLQAGRNYLDDLDRMLLQLDLPRTRLFRVTLGDREIGYMRQDERDGSTLQINGQPGPAGSIAVTTNMRLYTDEGTIDENEEAFVSDEGLSELFTHRRTLRPKIGHQNQTTSATGSSTEREIALSRQRLAANEEFVWERPTGPDGRQTYICQAEVRLLLPRLPRHAEPMAFYAYEPESGTIALMMIRVEQMPGGRYIALIRRKPTEPQEIWTFDRSGNPLTIQLPDGRTLIPSNAEEIRAIWQERDRNENAAGARGR